MVDVREIPLQSRQAQRRKLSAIAVHPLLFSAYPPLAVFAANLSLLPFGAALRAAAAWMLAACVLWAALMVVLRDHRRAGAATSVVVFAFFGYQALLQLWLRSDWVPSLIQNEFHFKYAFGFFALGLATLLAWPGKKTLPITRFLNAAGLLLILWPAVSIASGLWAVRNETRVAASKQGTVLTRGPGRLPDIFYIILDGYGRDDVIERSFGHSNREFLESLRSRGFAIPSDARSNYSQTDLSLCSSLNFDFVQNLVEPTGNASTDRALADMLIDDNAIVRELRPLGYEFVAITTGAPSIRLGKADLAMEATSGEELYWRALWSWTPFPKSERSDTEYSLRRRNLLIGGFETLKESAPGVASPRFVFAHILAPHPSFVVDASGRLKPKGPAGLWDANDYMKYGGTPESYGEGYINQLKFVNERLLTAIDAILTQDSPKPIVIVQGDHGPRLDFHHEDATKVNASQAFPILMAVHGPEPLAEALYPGMTPVNLFRLLLNTTFGANHPLLPDRSYYSPWSSPLSFIEMKPGRSGAIPGSPASAKP